MKTRHTMIKGRRSSTWDRTRHHRPLHPRHCRRRRRADMWQEKYASSSSQQPYYQQPQPSQAVPLQFYQPQPGQDGFYGSSRPSLDGNVIPQGSISSQPIQSYGGNIQPVGGWLSAFGTGGFEGEPPLLEGVYAGPALRCLSPHAAY